jgi:hypothetical protein
VTTKSETRDAYENAGHKQPREYPKLPRWEDLPIEMREAFISVYFAGRKAAAREQHAKEAKP